MSSANTITIKSMKDLLSREEFHFPKIGQILNGTIISTAKNSILIDLESKGIGIVYPGEFYDSPDRMKALHPGETVDTMLLELENADGYRELSLKAAQKTTAWQRIAEIKESGQTITTPVVNINKGGLIVEIEGIQGFLPLSQLSSEHYPKVEGGDTTKIVQVLQKFKGQEFKIKILDFSETETKLIVSERAIQEEIAKEELEKLEIGQTIEGVVTEVTDFGAFVKLSDKLDGLIHSSEIDWKYIENPREILHRDDTVEAKIISLDGGRVSLSLKALREDPWITVHEKFQVGQKVKGKILKIRSNGAFVKLTPDIVGLLPTSEFDGQNPSDAVHIDQELDLAIVNIDPTDHKLILTLDKKSEESDSKKD